MQHFQHTIHTLYECLVHRQSLLESTDRHRYRGVLHPTNQLAQLSQRVVRVVSCGLGVAFVSSGTRWRCPQGVVLLPVADLIFPLSFALIWKRDNLSPLLAKFVEDVRLMREVKALAKH